MSRIVKNYEIRQSPGERAAGKRIDEAAILQREHDNITDSLVYVRYRTLELETEFKALGGLRAHRQPPGTS